MRRRPRSSPTACCGCRAAAWSTPPTAADARTAPYHRPMWQHPWRWMRALSWPEWRLHPWRHAAVALAVAVGVALAFSVHLINASALSEFAGAVRAANGDPDLAIAARTRDGFDDALLAGLARDAAVRVASPVVELD